MVDEAQTVRFEGTDAFELAERLQRIARGRNRWARPHRDPVFVLHEGVILAGRYRISHRSRLGWVAYDERLTRPVVIDTLTGTGAPSERIRREAAKDESLCDAVVVGGEAFAIRPQTVR